MKENDLTAHPIAVLCNGQFAAIEPIADPLTDLRRRVEALEKARLDLAGHIADHGNHLLRLGNQVRALQWLEERQREEDRLIAEMCASDAAKMDDMRKP